MATEFGTIGNIPLLTVGGRTFTDLTTLLVLVAYVTGANRSTARLPGATSGYQVTSGKTYQIRAIQLAPSGTNGNGQLYYSDNDIGLSSGTALTNPIYQYGTVNAQGIPIVGSSTATIAPALQQMPVHFNVAAQKYPGIEMTNSGGGVNVGLHLFGYEV